MSNLPRINRQSAGYFVAQCLSTNDLFGNAYDQTNLPVAYAAEYAWTIGGDGLPVFQQITSTDGPIWGMFPWPGKSPRNEAQHSFCFPAKITTSGGGVLKATPVSTGSGSGWTAATDLNELQCYTSDGSLPSVGTFGLVLIGTEFHARKPLFFLGGGNALKWFKITVNHADGTYDADQYDHPRGATTGTSVTGMIEANLAPAVPVAAWVRASLENDGKWYFSLPLGC